MEVTLRVLTIIFFLFWNYFLKGQSNLDTAFISGYVLQEMPNEVINYDSTKGYIDVNDRFLFIPCDKNDCSILDSLRSYYNEGMNYFFTFCPEQDSYTFFKTICEIQSDMPDCTPLRLGNSNNYYKIRYRRSKYGIFHIYYLKGKWIRVDYNPRHNNLSSRFKVELINDDNESMDLYYLLEYEDLVDSVDIDMKRVRLLSLTGASLQR